MVKTDPAGTVFGWPFGAELPALGYGGGAIAIE
jgi:hypothetical protein